MDKRDQLIEIAAKLFSERGFENTPLSLICKTANVSKGLISHHFKSKDGLLREIFLKTTRSIVEMNAMDAANMDAVKRLEVLLEAFFSQLKTDKFFFQFNLNMMVQPNTREILKDLIKERSAFILEATRAIFDEIDAANSTIKSYAFIAELDGIAIHYLGVFDAYPLEEMKTYMIKKYCQ